MNVFHPGLVRFGFRQMLRSRKTWVAAAVSLVPLLAGILLIFTDASQSARLGAEYRFDPAMLEWSTFFLLGGTVPLVALLMAGGLLADEAQDRTLTYLLVRPIERPALYVSKFVPVAAVTMAMAAFQVLTYALARLVSLAINDPGARVVAADGTQTFSAAGVIGVLMLAGVVAAPLAALVYTAVFALVSLWVQRFHFLVNLLIYLVWELPFGTLGAGLGYFTVLYHAQSFMVRIDPTVSEFARDDMVHPAFAAVWLLLAAALWLWLGAWSIRKRDFHVTSAAT